MSSTNLSVVPLNDDRKIVKIQNYVSFKILQDLHKN